MSNQKHPISQRYHSLIDKSDCIPPIGVVLHSAVDTDSVNVAGSLVPKKIKNIWTMASGASSAQPDAICNNLTAMLFFSALACCP